MNATKLAYSADSKYLLRASENGAITLHAIHKDDGSPDKQIFAFKQHSKPLLVLDFLSSSEFISIDESGLALVVNFTTGEQIAQRLLKKHFKAALSPDKKILFIVQDDKEVPPAIKRLNSANLQDAGTCKANLKAFYIPECKLLGVSDRTCLLQYLADEYDGTPAQELVGIADFDKNKFVVNKFNNTKASDWDQERHQFEVHPSGLGVRLDYNNPIEIEKENCVICAEIFKFDTLQTVGYVTIIELKTREDIRESLTDNEPDSEEYKEARDELYSLVLAMKFSPDKKTLWVSFSLGVMYGVDLASGNLTRYMVNDAKPKKKGTRSNSNHEPSPHDNTILTISPDQQYIAFSFPNCFIPYQLPFQKGERIHKIVPGK